MRGHVTLPQVRAMYNGDRARKTTLVDYGFASLRLRQPPSEFEEFEQRLNQVVYVSATPGEYERTRSGQIVEQVIRPTGLLDPKVEVPPGGGADRRPHWRDQPAYRAQRAGAHHYPHKKMAEDLTATSRIPASRCVICTTK